MGLFRGFSAFPITPSDAAGMVDTLALERILETLIAAKVDSIGLLGSTGTYIYLTREERRRAIQTAVNYVGGRLPLMVGVGAFRTDDAIRLARDAEEAGADALLLAPISYIPLQQEEVFHHFEAVASATELPLCIYNNPTATHFEFSHELLIRLAHVRNIFGVKMPMPTGMDVGSELDILRPQMPEKFSIGYSNDPGASGAIAAGGDAWYSAIGGVLPIPTLQLCRAAQAGDLVEIDRINRVFSPLWGLAKSSGMLRVIYAVANGKGLFDGEAPRPILPLSPAQKTDVMKAVEALSALTTR